MHARRHVEAVQADEIGVTGHRMLPGMAIMVSTLAHDPTPPQPRRDRTLADRLLLMGNRVLPAAVRAARAHRRRGGVPQAYPPSLPKNGSRGTGSPDGAACRHGRRS